MKYKYYHISLITLLLALVATACKKSFLETVPKGKVVARTVSDYNLLLNNLDLLVIGDANAQVLMGDEVAAVDPYYSSATLKTQRSFRWDPVIYEPADDAGETLIPLKNIYNYNKIINEVPNATDGTEAQRLSIAAEARAGRAWTYFLLINYYGKPYNGVKSANDPGFPIIEAADVTVTKFTRASVQAVYDFIIKDLITAIPNLPVQITNRTRMSKSAAEGILGKVYMFMGRYSDALPMLNAAISDMSNQTTPVRLYDYNVEFATGGIFMPIDTITGPSFILLPNNYQSVYARQMSDLWAAYNNEIVITPQTSALYGPSDLRLLFYTNSTIETMIPYPVKGLLRKQSSSQVPFGVLVPDLYLLRAEAKCRNNDLNGAKADIEALRVKRMPAADAPVPSATSSGQLSLLQFILDERIREFAVTGMRWFDMRRLSVDPLFSSVSYAHTLYSETGNTTIYQLRPERFTLRLPQKLIDQNPDMQNNP